MQPLLIPNEIAYYLFYIMWLFLGAGGICYGIGFMKGEHHKMGGKEAEQTPFILGKENPGIKTGPRIQEVAPINISPMVEHPERIRERPFFPENPEAWGSDFRRQTEDLERNRDLFVEDPLEWGERFRMEKRNLERETEDKPPQLGPQDRIVQTRTGLKIITSEDKLQPVLKLQHKTLPVKVFKKKVFSTPEGLQVVIEKDTELNVEIGTEEAEDTAPTTEQPEPPHKPEKGKKEEEENFTIEVKALNLHGIE